MLEVLVYMCCVLKLLIIISLPLKFIRLEKDVTLVLRDGFISIRINLM